MRYLSLKPIQSKQPKDGKYIKHMLLPNTDAGKNASILIA